MSQKMPNTTSNQLEVEDIYAIGEERSRRRSSSKEPLSYTNRTVDRFAEAINSMNETVLMPSKLKDMEVTDAEVNDMLELEIAPKTDLFQYYTMLNNVKDDLFNGLSIADDMIPNGNNNYTQNSNNNGNNSRWDRQQSDDAFNSLTSLSSLSVSLDGEPASFEDRAGQLMSVFMQHLQSLYGILQHFTRAAEYITKRYQKEIDGTSDDQ